MSISKFTAFEGIRSGRQALMIILEEYENLWEESRWDASYDGYTVMSDGMIRQLLERARDYLETYSNEEIEFPLPSHSERYPTREYCYYTIPQYLSGFSNLIYDSICHNPMKIIYGKLCGLKNNKAKAKTILKNYDENIKKSASHVESYFQCDETNKHRKKKSGIRKKKKDIIAYRSEMNELLAKIMRDRETLTDLEFVDMVIDIVFVYHDKIESERARMYKENKEGRKVYSDDDIYCDIRGLKMASSEEVSKDALQAIAEADSIIKSLGEDAADKFSAMHSLIEDEAIIIKGMPTQKPSRLPWRRKKDNPEDPVV